jgi:acetylglutamate kinase
MTLDLRLRSKQRYVVSILFGWFMTASKFSFLSYHTIVTSAFPVVNPTNGGHSRIGTTTTTTTQSIPLLTIDKTKATIKLFATTNNEVTSMMNHEEATTINGSSLMDGENGVPLSMDDVESTLYELDMAMTTSSNVYSPLVKDGILPTADPSQIEFVTPDIVLKHDDEVLEKSMLDAWTNTMMNGNGHYPFAAMMQGSAPYIANHAGKVAVFHIPGDIFEPKTASHYGDALLQDIALCWLLDMKIVIIVAVQYATVHNNNNNIDEQNGATSDVRITNMLAHECHNALKVTSQTTLRFVEEEAGFLRTELERKLNRCLRAHHGSGDHTTALNRAPEGNIVSGNFYTAHRFGIVRGKDYEYTGYACETHTKNIRQVLDKNDIVLLSTVGLSAVGELVNVNGYHLAATVAASLQASKLIYIASQGSVLCSKKDHTPIQELPVSFAESITSYHQVTCSNMGFATFQNAKEQLHDSSAVELLLHMAWSCWSVKNGTCRAHICNPSDGSVLEELFTAKNGANTCIYHDNEIPYLVTSKRRSNDDETTQKDWDDFFASASAQGQTVTYFM